MIALLGTGLLGTGFTRALRRRGEAVTVWNRTPAKAAALAEVGAIVAADPAAAVRGASRVHLVLSDDDAVDAVLEAARPALAGDVLVIDHTTTSATGTRARAERWAGRGVAFLHAPVFMGPQHAHDSTGLMMVSGAPALVDRARPHLTTMTGSLIELGPGADTAAGYKLLGNLFLMFLTSGLADLLMLAGAVGLSPDDAARLLQFFNPGGSVAGRLARMSSGDYTEPSWQLETARKDARLMLEEAARAGRPLAVLPAIAARMDHVLATGAGALDWTVLGRDALAAGPVRP